MATAVGCRAAVRQQNAVSVMPHIALHIEQDPEEARHLRR
jgi:hypothetical protein